MMKPYQILLLMILTFAVAISCKFQGPVDSAQAQPSPSRISLSWESQPGRAEWSDSLVRIVSANLDSYDKAKDIRAICPKYSVLNQENRTKVIAELFVAMAKYESAWKPETLYRECNKRKCQYSSCQYNPTYGFCMKGGHKLDGGIVISRGLLQISLESALGYGCKNLETPQDIHDIEKNLACADTIMSRQIKNKGNIFIGSGAYWAVIKTTSSWQKINQITALVQKNVPTCKE